jgi:uncharacterized repeat protein (TIGR01451 family)
MRSRNVITALSLLIVAVGASPALASAPSPAWRISSLSEPTNFAPGSSGNLYAVSVTNTGGAVANESGAQPITVTDTLPPGLTATAISAVDQDRQGVASLTCELPSVTCTDASPVRLEDVLTVYVTVTVASSAKSIEIDQASVSGGGAPSAATSEATNVSFQPAGFGVQSFTASANNADGSVDTRAGDHPYSATATFALNTVNVGNNQIAPAGNLRDTAVDLPAGFIGDPLAVPRCPRGLRFIPPGIEPLRSPASLCPPESQVGSATVFSANGAGPVPFPRGPSSFQVPVYNLVPDAGEPAAFGFQVETGVAYLVGRVRSDGDYRITVVSSDVTEAVPVIGVSVTLWGVPGDPLHNAQREYFCQEAARCSSSPPPPFNGVVKPFLTNPTDCAEQASVAPITTFEADSWQSSGALISPAPAVSPAVTGCGALAFGPSLAVVPDTTQADAPAGLGVDLQVPQTDSPNTLATSELKDATVTLPAGVSVSPSAADGLQACSDTQIALSSPEPGACPPASQIATVQVATPLLSSPLEGQVFVGQPLCGPCTDADAADGNLFRLFLQVQGSGVVVKLPGTVSANPGTGRLTATFKNNPQLPFSDLKLQFKGGPRAPLATPQTCGTFTTTSDLAPWSAPETPDATPSSSFGVDWNGSGGACPASPPFAPSFTAGTVVPKAGGYSPLTVTLARSDREQDLSQVQLHMPPGLLGTLSSVPLCTEPQAALGTCSQASRIGTTTVAAGPGSDPFYLSGPVYLTGPYNGAPFGLSVAVPAVAGPFNLGRVVVRAAITIDPHTAAVTVTSGALPQIIDGVPVRLRTVNVTVDRPGFIFNPTNCSAQTITATIGSAQGATDPVSSPFAVGGCASLPFKPKFTASTQAKTSKANGASLDVKVAYPAGQANIRSVKVDLPKQFPSRLTTLQKACVAAVFQANPASCPAASVVGIARAVTPVLPVTLTGPAYLVSHGGAAFPDLVVVLQGDGVRVDLTGETLIKKGITTSTFKTVPDVPVSSFELYLPEGKYSILGANLPASAKYSLCGQTLAMPTTITGQNGAVLKQTTKIAVTGCPKAKKKKTKARKASHRHRNGRGNR